MFFFFAFPLLQQTTSGMPQSRLLGAKRIPRPSALLALRSSLPLRCWRYHKTSALVYSCILSRPSGIKKSRFSVQAGIAYAAKRFLSWSVSWLDAGALTLYDVIYTVYIYVYMYICDGCIRRQVTITIDHQIQKLGTPSAHSCGSAARAFI